jgi:CheY-like chemotaxis protein
MRDPGNLPSVLLVEDDPEVHNVLFEQLQDAQLNVTGVYTIHEAIRLIDEGYRPTVAVIDQTLPDGDGAEVCRRLKQLPEGARIPCLLHSAATNLEELAKAAGADAWLAKSTDMPTFRKLVLSLVTGASSD